MRISGTEPPSMILNQSRKCATSIFYNIFLFVCSGYKDNIHRDNDKVVLVHAVEMNEILQSQQWYTCKSVTMTKSNSLGLENTQ